MPFLNIHYLPLAWPFFFLLIAIFIVLLVLIEIGVLQFAYTRLGIDRRYVYLLLLLSLIGSYINIPIARFPGHQVLAGKEVIFFGMRYVIPVVVNNPGTILAVNVGGAVIPALLSLYLWMKNKLFLRGAVGITAVTFLVHALAYPVPGLGIAVPTLVPPVATAIVALILSRRQAAPLAYVSGSLGTLICADLLNIGDIQKLGAPVASIGGAGTFDGIFITGILAVILASIVSPGPGKRKRHKRPPER